MFKKDDILNSKGFIYNNLSNLWIHKALKNCCISKVAVENIHSKWFESYVNITLKNAEERQRIELLYSQSR